MNKFIYHIAWHKAGPVFASLALLGYLLFPPTSAEAAGTAASAVLPMAVLWVNPLWALPVFFSIAFWLYLISWVADDAAGAGLDKRFWSALLLISGWVGVLLIFLLHPVFFVLLLLGILGISFYYIQLRNAFVPTQYQLLTKLVGVKEPESLPGASGIKEKKTSIQMEDVINEKGENLKAYLDDHPEAEEAAELFGYIIEQVCRGKGSRFRIRPGKETYSADATKDGVVEKLQELSPDNGRELVKSIIKFSGLTAKGKPKSVLRIGISAGEAIGIGVKGIKAHERTGLAFSMPFKSPDAQEKDLAELGMDPETVEKLKVILAATNSSVIFSGPRRSGLTATFYGTLSLIDIFMKDVVAFEKSAARELNQIKQIEVDVASGEEFSKILPAVLRDEPHVLAVDGLSAKEVTASLFEFAADGGTVVGTMQAESIGPALETLKEQVSPELAVKSLKSIINQRLVRRLCTACRQEFVPEPRLLKKLKIDPENPGHWFNPVGCETCLSTGYDGLIGIYGFLNINEKVKELILHGNDTSEKKIKAAGGKDYRSIRRDGIAKVRKGLTTLDEVKRVLKNKS